MERIKQALEMARQERSIRQGVSPIRDTVAGARAGDTPSAQNQFITLDDAVLRENRIVTGLGDQRR